MTWKDRHLSQPLIHITTQANYNDSNSFYSIGQYCEEKKNWTSLPKCPARDVGRAVSCDSSHCHHNIYNYAFTSFLECNYINLFIYYYIIYINRWGIRRHDNNERARAPRKRAGGYGGGSPQKRWKDKIEFFFSNERNTKKIDARNTVSYNFL